jgi:glycerophosphoryl diester phosphodiesterase
VIPVYLDVTPAYIRTQKMLGRRVIPWTVNEPADMQRLAAWGVDGLITDVPDLARNILNME